MYLSSKNCFKLDEIVKSFEVAYRSYITTTLKLSYPTLSQFSIAVTALNDSLDSSSIILSQKYKQRIQRIKNEVASYYKKIEDCHNSYLNHDYHNDVPYVSEIIDFVLFFFNSDFSHLSSGFTSIEEFKDYSVKYNLVRNWLSHPASSKIHTQTSKEVLSFIRRLILNIDDSYFWYVPKKDLTRELDTFVNKIDDTPLRFHNLKEVGFSIKKIVYRENEINQIKEFLFGKDEKYRKSGSIVVYGYGGVGKTAIVLEFLYRTIKDVIDETINEPIEFILFFTSKEEILSISETTGEIYITEINKQISSFGDFKTKTINTLHLRDIEKINDKRGIIVLDNFESLPEDEKTQFFTFIRQTSRNVQFILTSRNEESCEDKLNLKEFREECQGIEFIDEYVEANDFRISLNSHAKKELVNLSKGNTLILVLTIQMINQGIDINQILGDLRSIESSNIEVIADFMYKNTINSAIEGLEKEGHKPIEILKVISLYEIPIDIYSISKLSNQEVNSVEYMCKILTKKLVLEKLGESFHPNEFANKFILTKYIPHNVEKKEIRQRIKQYQKGLERKLSKLEETKKREPLLSGIMDDWKPNNSIDKIAIAEAFSLFDETRKACNQKDIKEITRVREEFQRIEKMTSHPYIKFQKARCHELFLRVFKKPESREKIIKIMIESYEDAIESTDFYYPYIKNTKSYGSINWIYGLFLSSIVADLPRALRYLEDAVDIFKRIKLKDKTYYTALNNLSWAYAKLYEKSNDKRYLKELKPLYLEVIRNRVKVKALDFDFRLYKLNFQKYFPRNNHNS